jgi:hypothetical protein
MLLSAYETSTSHSQCPVNSREFELILGPISQRRFRSLDEINSERTSGLSRIGKTLGA